MKTSVRMGDFGDEIAWVYKLHSVKNNRTSLVKSARNYSSSTVRE
jgi:hypothetical protein